MKSQGFSQTPQDIMEEYNGCSVGPYTAYPSDRHSTRGCTVGLGLFNGINDLLLYLFVISRWMEFFFFRFGIKITPCYALQ